MTWTRLDDNWDTSSKLIRAAELLKSDAPHAMWARGVTHCNRELTNGRVFGSVLRSKTLHRRPQEVVDALVKVGALVALDDDEYLFHNFHKWNETREAVEARRKQKQAVGKNGGKASGESRRHNGEANANHRGSGLVQPETNQTSTSCSGFGSTKTNPSPSPSPSPSPDPDQIFIADPPASPPSNENAPAAPSPKAKKAKGAKTSCPGIDATDEVIESWLATEGLPSLMSEDGSEVERMMDYHRKESKQSGAWKSSWRTWTNNWETYGRKTFGPARGEQAEEGELPPLKVKAPPPVFDNDAPDVPMPENGDQIGALLGIFDGPRDTRKAS